MFKIDGLQKLRRELKEAERAIAELDGELGVVGFDAQDPSSIEAAIQSVCRMIDDRVGQYESNPYVGPMIEQLKETYRENIVQKAAEARLQAAEDD